MRHWAAAGLVACALGAYAQVPPEPLPPNQAPPAAAASSQPQSPESPQTQSPAPQPAAGEAPPPETAGGQAAKAAQPPPAAKLSAPKASPVKPPAPAREESARDPDVAALRREVNRLQSELDAERAAAALTPAEDISAASRPVHGAWGWFVATALLALGAGFVLGWRLLDRRIRRQYGGLRIY